MSCSAMRYSREFDAMRRQLSEIGELRMLSITMAKSWRRYGIHALEAVYPFLAPGGWISATNTGREDAAIVHLKHESGVDVLVNVGDDWFGGFGLLVACGTRGHRIAQFSDSFSAFKLQLQAFVEYLRTGQRPFAFEQTSELIRLLVAGERSLAMGGASILMKDLIREMQCS